MQCLVIIEAFRKNGFHLDAFCVCFGKKYISVFLTKMGKSANEGGMGSSL